MITCPLCGFDNIEGVDSCEQCGQSLSESHLLSPKNAAERGLLQDTVETIARHAPVVVEESVTVREVLKLLVEKQIGCVFVVDANHKVVGVFSERDAVIRVSTQLAELGDEPISKLMTADPQTLEADTRVAFAVHQMDIGGFRHLPIVTDDGTAQGVVSARDIVNYLHSKVGS